VNSYTAAAMTSVGTCCIFYRQLLYNTMCFISAFMSASTIN